MKTSVTIISTNLNRNILDKYKNYHVIDDSFNCEDLLQYKNIIFYNILNNYDTEKLFKYLDSNNIRYINCTNKVEDALYTDYLIIYDEEKILAEGNTLDILSNSKLIKRLGFSLPFYIDLSLLLKDYGLIDKIYTDKESIKRCLWK